MHPKTIANGTIASLVQDEQNEVQHDFFGHVTPMALASASHDVYSIAIPPLHSLCPDDQSEGQHDFSCLVIPLALVLASHDAVGIFNVIIIFLR